MTYSEQVKRPAKRSRFFVSLLAFLFPLFLCGGLASGYFFYDTVREYIASTNLPDFGTVSLGTQVQQAIAPIAAALPNVAAGDRVNVLILGIDKRPDDPGPYRTDTMIVATLDPKTKTAGMLSVPRDLYVPIPYPGVGSDRINTANFFGDVYKYPGGGPALAKKTIEYNLGIPIHFYVLIDFDGFKKIVDALGGIDVDVPTPIDDPAYPTEDYKTKVIHIPAGHLHMNGELALEYARSRHTTNDFDRSKRQMQIIKAVRDKALQLNMLTQLPQLYTQYKDTVKTDMSLQQMLVLAPIAAQVRPDNISSRAIDQTMTTETRLDNGADVLWPDRAKIGEVVNQMFPAPGNGAKTATAKQETARIVVLNGTTKSGYAELCANYLKSQGFNVIQVGNADRATYKQTLILDSGTTPNTLASLVKAIPVLPNNISKLTSTTNADIQVIVGADWAPPQ